ncbi:DUF2982 domain-containing protein [Paraglaciecola aquimarina]|uniref:DUF2982 domain-containing protein n=1 Tax=Paraglaciecola aquimarina TaxID=1235557 RepID=A0ABU3SUI7_9ALTE|nr:DUF2982 domain-containing protein [Paraglaciecola aquimarina]MDU0353680.1 DUF2982 domain-containing protein [Paraglaciecola aquimarina]
MSIVALVVAWVKYREPEYSFILSKNEIVHKRRQGNWTLSWSNIQRIDIPSVNRGFASEKLDMIGIKLKDYPTFLSVISPRLMTNILMEQRSLLLHSTDNCSSGSCYGEDLLEDDYYKTICGREYKGVQAMFANRMSKLRERLGYDIYISASDLDRSEIDFVNLLKRCQQHVSMHNAYTNQG